MYSRVFFIVVSSTAFILRRVLMDGSKAWFISCLTICFNLAGRFVVVKAELVLSREEVLGWGLYLNLVEGEEKSDVFGEDLDLAAQTSLRCFCIIGGILWKYCAVDGDTLGGVEMGFGVKTLGSLKVVGCCGFISEEALEKIK